MDFYFTDRKFNTLGVASTGAAPIQIDADTDTQMRPQAVGRTYAATLVTDPANAEKLATMAALGNFLLYEDPRGQYVFATIMEWTEYDPQAGELSFSAENGGVDLINETVGAYTADKAYSIADYIKRFTADSGFEIGINELAGQTRTLKWEGNEDTALKRIESVATQFDNAELDFRFEVDGMQVVHRYIDIYEHMGVDKSQRLEVNTQLNRITTTGNIYDLCTSIKGTGAAASGSDTPINLVGYHWTDPDGRYVLGGDGVLRDTVAVQLWSRALSNDNPNPTAHHIQRVKSYEATTQATLLQSVLADLKQYNHAAINYTVDIADLPDGVYVGDTVHLVDEAQGLNLSARLLELKDSYAADTHEATLGDYLIEASQIDPALQELADQMKTLAASRQWYPWTRYADDDAGTGISADPAGKAYMAIVWSENAVPSDDPADYAGKWQKVKGDDGVGEPGPKGNDGKTSYFHTAYADDVNGGGFSQSPTGKAYIGTYVDFTEADSANASDYTWVLIKGTDGKNGSDGKDGADGVAGKDGVGIKSTAIAYQASTSGTTAPTGTWLSSPTATAGQYQWTRTVWTYTDGTTETGYSVGHIGANGANGQDGVAGKDGVGIKSTTITYQGGTSGTVKPTGTWVANPPSVAGGNYLWTRTIWSYTDGSSETGYSVAKAGEKGDKGDTGDRGLQGLQGPKGDQGIAGPKGTDGKTQYTHIAYANSADGVTDFTVSDSNRTYIGMYVDFTSTDSTKPTDYSWTLVKGADGANGTPGKAGADGRTPYFHIAYADSADGKDGFYVGGGTNLLTGTSNVQDYTVSGSGWATGSQSYNGGSKSIPVTPGASYTYSAIVKSTTYDCYPEIQFFDRDKKWISNSINYPGTGIGVRYASGVAPAGTAFLLVHMVLNNPPHSQTLVFNSEKLELGTVATPWSPAPSEAHPIYMGTYTDYTQADSLDQTAYLWSQIKGDDGKDGVPGKDGLGIKSTAIAYQASTSGTTAPTGTWLSSPTATAGQYQWTRTVWTYTDGTTETGYSVGHIGANGANGQDGVAGKDGVGIKSTTITYATSASGTSAPTSGWIANPPATSAGQYIWTKTVWSYTDGTNETGYSVGKIGEKGATGNTGATGADGNGIKSSSVTYQVGTSGTTAPTGTWSSSVPTASQGAYLWSQIVTTYTDGTQNTAYSVAYQAKDGAKGDPGSQDVPMTYVQTDQPAGTIVKDSLWWVGTAMNNVTALKRWNGSDWVPETIAQAVLNIKELNAVTINSGSLNSPLIKVPFEHMVIDSENTLGSGTMMLDGPKLTLDGTIDGGTQKFQVQLAGDGFSSIITGTDGDLNFPVQRAVLTKGELDLSYAYGGSGENKKYINSVFNAGGAARYFKSVDLAETANFSSAHIRYMRQGAVCAVAFNVALKSDAGWVGLSTVPVGYTPSSNYIGTMLVSTSYQGQFCALYYNSQGWRLIPTKNQGTGGFQGVVAYTTNDDYPYEDATI